MTAVDLTAHLGLFKLGWQRDPSQLPRPRGADHLTVETAAWLAEFDEQLTELAAARDITLVLMGGNAAALRMEAATQRGSRDNDYLTDASGEDIEALMADLAARFAPVAPLFVPRLHVPEGATPLALRTYYIPVPALYAETRDGLHPIKVEFHIDIDQLPPSETITSAHFALPHPVRATVPKLPYQVALKLLTLTEPPVGLALAREGVLPRQVYDLDQLTQRVADAQGFDDARAYADALYAKECTVHGTMPRASEPWAGIERRMERWAAVDTDGALGAAITAFQEAQVPSVTRRGMTQWRARIRRVQLAARCIAGGAAGYDTWRQLLSIDARIPETVRGRAQIRSYRAPITDATGVPHHQLPPRVHLWDGLASVADLPAALTELAATLR